VLRGIGLYHGGTVVKRVVSEVVRCIQVVGTDPRSEVRTDRRDVREVYLTVGIAIYDPQRRGRPEGPHLLQVDPERCKVGDVHLTVLVIVTLVVVMPQQAVCRIQLITDVTA